MINKKIIKQFFIKRFNREPKQDKIYFEEWERRFKTPYVESFMDDESLKVWQEIKNTQMNVKGGIIQNGTKNIQIPN